MRQIDRDITIVKKIIKYCDEIGEANAQFDNSLDKLKTNSIYKNSVSMCILQIGELTMHLSDEFRLKFSEIPWKSIRGMRNIVAHHYGDFDIEILYNTVVARVPELREYCLKCLAEMEGL